MKFRHLLLAAAVLLAFTACGPSPAAWSGTSNPLDTPDTFVQPPPSMGRFGPHSEYYSGEALARSNP